MIESSKVLKTLNTSPSVELLRLRNRDMIVEFLIEVFSKNQVVITSDKIHTQLADFLEYKKVENDEESEITVFDTYEEKAKNIFSIGLIKVS